MKSQTRPCPYCGQEIAANATVCRHCGSDEQTGWSEERYLDGIDLPDDDEYSRLLEKEFPSLAKGNAKPPVPIWVVVSAVLLLIVFVLVFVLP